MTLDELFFHNFHSEVTSSTCTAVMEYAKEGSTKEEVLANVFLGQGFSPLEVEELLEVYRTDKAPEWVKYKYLARLLMYYFGEFGNLRDLDNFIDMLRVANDDEEPLTAEEKEIMKQTFWVRRLQTEMLKYC